MVGEMSNLNPRPPAGRTLELPVDELLRRARPLPPHEEMVIDDLTEEEGAAFLALFEDFQDLPEAGRRKPEAELECPLNHPTTTAFFPPCPPSRGKRARC